jgi:hypothetical protein
MIEFHEYRANPCAPTILVNKLCAIYWSDGLFKCTYGLSSSGPGGFSQCTEQLSLLWQPPALFEAQHNLDWALREWRVGNLRTDDTGRHVLAQ